MTALVNEIIQTLAEFVLVLDDYHLMAALLREAHTRAITPAYIAKLLAAFPKDEGGTLRVKAEAVPNVFHPSSFIPHPLADPLSKQLQLAKLHCIRPISTLHLKSFELTIRITGQLAQPSNVNS